MRGDRPAVGDTIILTHREQQRYRKDAHKIGTVVRVGRTIFDVEVGVQGVSRSSVIPVAIGTWFENMGNRGGTAHAAFTPDEYAELPEREAMIKRVRNDAAGSRWERLSTEQLRRVCAVLDEVDA